MLSREFERTCHMLLEISMESRQNFTGFKSLLSIALFSPATNWISIFQNLMMLSTWKQPWDTFGTFVILNHMTVKMRVPHWLRWPLKTRTLVILALFKSMLCLYWRIIIRIELTDEYSKRLFLVLQLVSDQICLFVFQFWKDSRPKTLIGPNLLIEYAAIVINCQFRNHQVPIGPEKIINQKSNFS